MNKLSLDLYGVKNKYIGKGIKDSISLYNLYNDLENKLNIKYIFKPTIVPYFYGKQPMDDGVSCFCMFKEKTSLGFITLHTFNKRNVAYFDMVSNKKYKNAKNIVCNFLNPKNVQLPQDFKKDTWGIELTSNCVCKNSINSEFLYDLCQEIIKKINMTQIATTTLQKTKDIIFITTLIAESHIAMFYNINTKQLFIDIFSCKYYNFKKVIKLLNDKKIELQNYSISSRGIYHNNLKRIN